MAFNFQRPNLPYEGESLQNDKRYRLLEAQGKPPTAQMFDADFNCLTDNDRKLDAAIAGISVGIIPGAGVPENANRLPVTDGATNISWVLIRDQYIEDESISASKFIPGTITALQMMDGTLAANKLAPNAITTIKILDFNVTANKLSPDAVTTIKILDENVTTPKIADDAVTTEKIPDNAITTAKILDGNVTTPKIPDNAITTPKILDANVTTSKIADGNITLPKIGPNVLTPPAVKSDQIAANSTAVYTNPSVQQHHPSAAKFWCNFDGSLTGTNPPSAGYNVASVTRNSAGVYTINFNTPFTSSNYCVIASSRTTTVSGTDSAIVNIQSLTTSSVQIRIGNINTFAADSAYVSVAGFGLQ